MCSFRTEHKEHFQCLSHWALVGVGETKLYIADWATLAPVLILIHHIFKYSSL